MIVHRQAMASLMPYLLSIVLCVGVGFFAGRVIGGGLISSVMLGSNPLPLLLATPTEEYGTLYRLLNSEQTLQRLAGYYGLIDYRMTDPDFLVERYDAEPDPVVRRTLVWLMGFSPHTRRVSEFCDRIYRESPPAIQAEVVRTLSRTEPARLDAFRRRHGIKP